MIFYFLACLLLLATVDATYYQDCGTQGAIISMNITDCIYPPCIAYKPGEYNVDILFIAAADAQTLNTEIYAQIGSTNVPWPGPDACGLLLDGGSCPIVKSFTYRYQAIMPVLPEYPTLSTLVTWILVDENEIQHVCFQIPITIVDS